MYRFNPSQFNPPQLKAVLHDKGPILVLAGAGSGKTRIIAHRIAYLISERHINPENIVAVSFTNKAARELKQRVGELIGPDLAARSHLSTFHALGADILRTHITKLGWKLPFAIIDTEDQVSIIKNILKDLHLQGSAFDPQNLISFISRVKTAHLDVLDMPGMRWNPQGRSLARIFNQYQIIRRSMNAIDFDDMIALPVDIFEQFPDVLTHYSNHWQYLLVDEYQDTNALQFRLLQLLCRDQANLMVVGDDDQSIYGFRGADSRHILEFPDLFPNVETVSLEQNYRSTQIILDAANAVIARNATRHPKKLWTEVKTGEKIRAFSCEDPEAEAAFVIEQIRQQRAARNLEFRDFAILYRTNPQSRVLEEALVREAMPYRVVGGSKFYDHSEIRDLIFYLRSAFSFHDELALRRIINTPRRGIAATALSRMDTRVSTQNISFFEAMRLESQSSELQPASRLKLAQLVDTLERFHKRFMAKSEPLAKTLADLLDDIHYTAYIQSSSKSDDQAQQRRENIDEFLNALATYENHEGRDLFGFLQRVALEPPSKSDDNTADEITLMTIHSAKGLEFPAVYIVGCEENLLPHQNSLKEPALSEERRLFYVGITRAKKYLTITYSQNRRKLYDKIAVERSRFMNDIPADVITCADSLNSDDAQRLKDENAARLQERLERMRSLFK